MPKFKVQVTRTITQYADVVVECDDIEDADDVACDAACGEPSKWKWADNDHPFHRDEYYHCGEIEDIEAVPEPTGTLYTVEIGYTSHGNTYFQLHHPNPKLTHEELYEYLCEHGFPDDVVDKQRDGDWDIEEFAPVVQPCERAA